MKFQLKAQQILNSRGRPTIQVWLYTDDYMVVASVPTGKSTGKHEAKELRDNDPSQYGGFSVHKAVDKINNLINKEIANMSLHRPDEIDKTLLKLDGTPDKSNLGANAILAVSLAVYKAASIESGLPLYRYLHHLIFKKPSDKLKMPTPLFNIINGGAHGHETIDIQEFHLIGQTSWPLSQKIVSAWQVIDNLRKSLSELNLAWGYGDEGGFLIYLFSNEEAITLILEAIKQAGFRIGEDFSLGLDVAATNFYQSPNYQLKEKAKPVTSKDLLAFYRGLISKYPIKLIEDPFAEIDLKGWHLANKLTGSTLVVADDLTATHLDLMVKYRQSIDFRGVIVKPNQIGCLSQTLEFISKAYEIGVQPIVSHRSGETCDPFIADLAVAAQVDYVKLGNLRQGERIAKINRLIEIDQELNR